MVGPLRSPAALDRRAREQLLMSCRWLDFLGHEERLRRPRLALCAWHGLRPYHARPPFGGFCSLQLAYGDWTHPVMMMMVVMGKTTREKLALGKKRARACGYCRAMLQAEGESPVTANHSFPASSSEERHHRRPDQGPPRRGSPQSGLSGPHAWNLAKVDESSTYTTGRGQDQEENEGN